jgi:hypothetical protein
MVYKAKFTCTVHQKRRKINQNRFLSFFVGKIQSFYLFEFFQKVRTIPEIARVIQILYSIVPKIKVEKKKLSKQFC